MDVFPKFKTRRQLGTENESSLSSILLQAKQFMAHILWAGISDFDGQVSQSAMITYRQCSVTLSSSGSSTNPNSASIALCPNSRILSCILNTTTPVSSFPLSCNKGITHKHINKGSCISIINISLCMKHFFQRFCWILLFSLCKETSTSENIYIYARVRDCLIEGQRYHIHETTTKLNQDSTHDIYRFGPL